MMRMYLSDCTPRDGQHAKTLASEAGRSENSARLSMQGGSMMIRLIVLFLLAGTGTVRICEAADKQPLSANPSSSLAASRGEVSKQQSLEIETGHAHVLKLPGARQVAVGNSQILQASANNSSEVILFGKRPGTTSVDVWTHKGLRQSFRIVVHAADRAQMFAEIRSLLKDVPAVQVLTAGSRIVLQADSLTSMQREIVDRILVRFPEVVDMTSGMSWDPMVMLDVMVIEMPTYKLSELGVRWQAAQGNGGVAGFSWQAGKAPPFGQMAMQQLGVSTSDSQVGPGLAVRDPRGQASGDVASWLGLNTVLHAELQAMADRGEALLLAQPQLMTRSGKTASFLAGGEVPYALTDEKGRTHTEFKKYGVSLNVTPELGDQGRIVASVEVEVSAVDSSIITPAGPAMRVRKASTQFNAYSGQTMVLAGFMSSDRSSNYRGAPTPEGSLLEKLTGVQDERTRQTELAILVTPILTQADDPAMRERVRRAQTFAQVEAEPTRRLLDSVSPAHNVMRSEWLDRQNDDLTSGPAGIDQWGAQTQISSPWEQFEPSVSSSQWANSDVQTGGADRNKGGFND